MKDYLKFFGIGILVISTIIVFSFGTGNVSLFFKEFFGVRNANIERKVFKSNKIYTEGMASDLAKYRYEWTIQTDATAKKAIEDLIRSKYADFDETKLEDYELAGFLLNIKGGY